MSLILIGGVVLAALVLAFVIYTKSIRFAGPNQAMLITSKGGQAPELPVPPANTSEDSEAASRAALPVLTSRVIINGRVFVNPMSSRVHYIDLSSRQVEVTIEGISNNGIMLRLTGVAQVKVGGDAQSVRRAAQRFLQQQEAIDHYTQETLSGSLRSIVGTLSVEEIIKDRAALNAAVKSEAEHSMNNQGLEIDTFQIKSVDDPSGYLRNLGRPEAAAAARNADIAEANANREAAENRAIAEQKIAEANQKLALRQAELKQETDTRQAEADAAGPLAVAAQRESILLREQQVVAREAELKERQLDVDVRKPADAAKYKVETEAAADLEKRRRSAEASKVEAEASLANTKFKAEGELATATAQAAAATARGNADAAIIKSKGEAEAETIKARGLAEAAGVEASAKAYAEFNEAGILNKVMETLPLIAKEIAAPMSAIDNLTVVSNDGASSLSKNVVGGANETMEMLKAATGIDFKSMISNIGKKGGTDEDAIKSIVSAIKSSEKSAPVEAEVSENGKKG